MGAKMTAILGGLMLAVGSIAAPAFTSLCHAAWQSAHGDSANTGFEGVDTAPAQQATQTQPLGSIAPGTNPVVGPNGDVYIGNLEGELRAFHADGTPYWTRKLNSLHGGIFAAPVVGADGSIYVVSGVHYTDHRDGVRNERNDSFLHKFSPGGAWNFVRPFPGTFRIANRCQQWRDHRTTEYLALEWHRGDHRTRVVQIACCPRPAPDRLFDRRDRAGRRAGYSGQQPRDYGWRRRFFRSLR
jgi:hypothetical protein